jgi:HlyD family secretion protein
LFLGAPVADILDRSSLYVEIFLEEPELSRLALGRDVDVLVDGMEGKVYSGTITYFGQKAEFSPKYIISEKERRSLLYRVKVGLSGDLEVFKLGMPVTVRIGNHDPGAE